MGEKEGARARTCANCPVRKAGTALPGICTQCALEKGHGSSGETRVAPRELHLPLPGRSQKLTGHIGADRVVGTQPAPKEENYQHEGRSSRLLLLLGIPTQLREKKLVAMCRSMTWENKIPKGSVS